MKPQHNLENYFGNSGLFGLEIEMQKKKLNFKNMEIT